MTRDEMTCDEMIRDEMTRDEKSVHLFVRFAVLHFVTELFVAFDANSGIAFKA